MKRSRNLIFSLALMLCMLSTLGTAQYHEISISKAGWVPENESEGYRIPVKQGYVEKMIDEGRLYHDVNFPPSANGMNVSRLSMTFYIDGGIDDWSNLSVSLYKIDRWTGYAFYVAHVGANYLDFADQVQTKSIPKSQMRATGIDNHRYAWFLKGYFGKRTLKIYMVVIRYE